MKHTVYLGALLVTLMWGATVQAQTTISLAQAQAQAEGKNEIWKITQLRIAQAQEDVSLAWSGLVPVVSAAASVTRNPEEVRLGDNVIQQLYVWDVSARGTMRLFDPSQWSLISQAKSSVASQRADANWQREQLKLEVTRAWFVLLAAQEQTQVLDEILEIREKEVTRVEALIGAARAVPLDLERAKADALATKQRQIEAVAALANASDALAVLIDAPFEQPLRAAKVTANTLVLKKVDPERLVERADFQASVRAIEAAESAESVNLRQWWPTVDLSGGASLGPPNLTRPNGSFWSITLGLNWVIFDGGRRMHQADQLEARTQELRQTQRLQLRQERAAIRIAKRQFDATQQNEAVIEARQKNAKKALELAQKRYQASLATALDVREATEALLEAKIARINNALAGQLAWARYQTLVEF